MGPTRNLNLNPILARPAETVTIVIIVKARVIRSGVKGLVIAIGHEIVSTIAEVMIITGEIETEIGIYRITVLRIIMFFLVNSRKWVEPCLVLRYSSSSSKCLQ